MKIARTGFKGFVSKDLEDALKLEQGYTDQKDRCLSCSYLRSITDQVGHDEPGCSLHASSLNKLVKVSESGYCNRFTSKNKDVPHDWSFSGGAS